MQEHLLYMINYYIQGTVFTAIHLGDQNVSQSTASQHSQGAMSTAFLVALTLGGVSQLAPSSGETVIGTT